MRVYGSSIESGWIESGEVGGKVSEVVGLALEIVGGLASNANLVLTAKFQT